MIIFLNDFRPFFFFFLFLILFLFLLKKTNFFVFNKIYSIKFLCKIFAISIVGLLSKLFIKFYLDIDVFTDYTSIISLTYYLILSIYIYFIKVMTNFLNNKNLIILITLIIVLSLLFFFILIYLSI